LLFVPVLQLFGTWLYGPVCRVVLWLIGLPQETGEPSTSVGEVIVTKTSEATKNVGHDGNTDETGMKMPRYLHIV
jgi:hypothetical protein